MPIADPSADSGPDNSGPDNTAPDNTAPDNTAPDNTAPDDASAGEAALVQRARLGERQALELLLRGQYDRIHAVCRRITGNPTDAADAAQNALIAVTRGLVNFDDRSRFSSWVYRIAVNSSIDELRRRSRARTVSLDDLGAVRAPAGRADPESTATRVDVEAALRRLSLEFRAPVVLRDMCGLDYAEIAEILQVPPGTVRSRIARGRAALVRLMEPSRSDQ